MKKLIPIAVSLCLINFSGCKDDQPDSSIENPVQAIKSDTVYFLGSSTIEYFENSLAFWPENYNLKTINLGKGGELIDSMCIRIGAFPVHAKFKDQNIYAGKKNYFEADWGLDYSLKPFNAKINNIEGVIAIDNNGYYFESNTEIDVDPTYSYEVKSLQNFVENSVFIVNLGKNNLLNNTNDTDSHHYVLNKSKECIQWISKNVTNRIIVMGHFSSQDANESLNINVKALNENLLNYYPIEFYNINQYLQSQEIWEDTKIQPTDLDRIAQNVGNLPVSLSNDAIHLNLKTNIAVTNKLYQSIKLNGWVN